jgi:hypothetical protein
MEERSAMPPSVSNVSLKMVEAVRLREDALDAAQFPVWIDSRMITGYFPALEMKRLISEREDLSYIGKVNRNCDKGSIPGFSFIREGAESLNEYVKTIDAQQKAAQPVG